MNRKDISMLWDKFKKETRYVTFDGKILIETLMIDFVIYVEENKRSTLNGDGIPPITKVMGILPTTL